ncbi:MAG: DUF1254 domain-containing protein [Rhodovulum sulfidophilum]|uniref:DUF1254 domain-containing protein n=1 Tax=Rhodovulum sulfidophilum TaxID=35806 RepID=A0A2W5PQD4_RHOSU|nr:MAG: DUF1254 domain-containing protein [Rhodovulum sulfidophilum]
MSRASVAAALAAASLVLGSALPSAPALAREAPSEATVDSAYVYLLGRSLAIRQEHMDRAAEGFAYNEISYNPLGSADFVNPSFDVAYLEAWIAVDADTPALLEVPEIEQRYYTAQILDEWGEVIANVNERTFPSKPHGTFALVAPGSIAPVPEGAGRIELHGNKAKLLGRVEIEGDPKGAVALQHRFTLRSTGTPEIADPPALPDFDNAALMDAGIFDHTEVIIAGALDVSPVAAQVQQAARAVAAPVASSDAARAGVDALLRDKVVPAFQQFAQTEVAPYRDHWLFAGIGGTYGADFRARSAVNYAGTWANVPTEVVYFLASRDADEAPLDGSRSYVMHFPADRLPQSVVDGYWSVILVGVPDYRVVPNPLDRFNFNTYSNLEPEADGSMKIGIGPAPVDGVPEANWLPSAAGKPISLTYRAYVPKAEVLEGRWQPPALVPVN